MKMRYRLLPDGWIIADPISGATLMEIKLPADATMCRELALYGLKQLIADAGALNKGSSRAARLIEMNKRYTAVIQGQWNNRAGGQPVRLPDADIFNALVGLGIIKSDERAVNVWTAASAGARRKYAERSDVRDWLRRNAPQTADADAALAAFVSAPTKSTKPADPKPADPKPADPVKS